MSKMIKKSSQEQSVVNTTPKWILEMHNHYRATGVYRALDLRRILGDPRDVVQIVPESNPLGRLLNRRKK